MEALIIKIGEWISIGKNHIPAVVCSISESREQAEIVYEDDKGKAINEEVRWNGSCWEFVVKGPSGGYADNSLRLQNFVNILRAGRWHKSGT